MSSFILALIFAALMLTGIILNKTYHHLPAKELKRLARDGDPSAKILYKAVAYSSLYTLLWLVIILSAAASFTLFALSSSAWLAFSVVAILLWLGFLWLPSSKLSSFSVRLAQFMTPTVAWILQHTHSRLEALGKKIRLTYPINLHTGLYTREDLLELLGWQKKQTDNRIPEIDLATAERALTFGTKKVSDILTPRRVVKIVGTSDTIGPILMNELHDSGHSCFPVTDSTKDERIVGALYVHDLLEAKQGGKVSSVMRRDVQYVHEDFTLHQVMQGFSKTNHHLFIVVNSFEEFVGVVTIDDVLGQLIGQPLVGEFDDYGNLRAVAEAQAKKDHEEHSEAPADSEDKKE